MEDVEVAFMGWRARRRLRPLVVRPRSREMLDRFGLIVGVYEVRCKLPYKLDRIVNTVKVR